MANSARMQGSTGSSQQLETDCQMLLCQQLLRGRVKNAHLHDGAANEAHEGSAVLPQHMLYAGAVQAGNAVLQQHSRNSRNERSFEVERIKQAWEIQIEIGKYAVKADLWRGYRRVLIR